MKLTCVTAVFNAVKAGNRERLIRCVESVAKLKIEHEHLIYDGASTDGTVELLRELEAKTPGLKVVSEPDTGIYNALNKGVRDAQGEWFYVLGCDDYICKPEVMDRLIADAVAAVDVIASVVSHDGPQGVRFAMREKKDLRFLFERFVCCHQGEIARTSWVRFIGGFDERYHLAADTNMFLLFHISNACFRYVFEDFAMFHLGGSSFAGQKSGDYEVRMCISRAFHLSEKEFAVYERTHLLPLRKYVFWLFHRDLAVRLSARYSFSIMLRSALKMTIRLMFYPLVVWTRPLRYRSDRRK